MGIPDVSGIAAMVAAPGDFASGPRQKRRKNAFCGYAAPMRAAGAAAVFFAPG